MPRGFELGVDFGTSNTAAVLRWPDGQRRPLLFDGVPLLPSAVYREETGRLPVGTDAPNAARVSPGRYEPNPKRRVDEGQVLLGTTPVPVADLIGAVLRRVADEATRVAGGPVPDVTLTHPAGWGARRRKVLVSAGASAGWTRPTLVAEPVAAATAFLERHPDALPTGSSLLVYDFGAGTF